MRTKRPRKYAVINNNVVPKPVTKSYEKFLKATLPVRETHSKLRNTIKPKHEE